MKKTTHILTTLSLLGSALFILPLTTSAQVTAPDPTALVQTFTIKFDKLGDATMEVSQKMDAAQFENWQNSEIAKDPSLAKRDLERSMATYVLEDFKRDVDDMNRSSTISVKLKGYAQYNGGGNWQIRLDSKNPDVTKLADNAYMMTSNTMMGGQLVQQIFKIYFPSGASDIQQTTDSFGKAIFTYKVGGALSWFLLWNNLAGILVILAGLALLFRSYLLPAKQLRVARTGSLEQATTLVP